MTTMTTESKPRLLDITLALCAIVLSIFGIMLIFDARIGHTGVNTNPYALAIRQSAGLFFGVLAVLVMLKIKYFNLKKIAYAGAWIGLVLLVIVFFFPARNGATRWINLGSFSFQPSEVAKITLIILLSYLFSKYPLANMTSISKLKQYWKPLAIGSFMTIAYLVLIEREPDLGTALVMFMSVITMLYLSGMRRRIIAAILGVACLLGILSVLVYPHRMSRFVAFTNPNANSADKSYQPVNAERAIGAGGLVGMGWGYGNGKKRVPEAHTDYIFTTLGEDLGFVGSLFVLSFSGMVVWRGFRISEQSKDAFGKLLAGGLTSLIAWQTLLNLLVAVHVVPATGVPLPFLSFGNTALVMTLFSVGIILSVGQYPNRIRRG